MPRAYLPFRRDALHGAAHQGVGLQHGVEVLHRQREHVAVGLGAHARHAPRVGQQANLAEIGAVGQRGGHLPRTHHNIHNAWN